MAMHDLSPPAVGDAHRVPVVVDKGLHSNIQQDTWIIRETRRREEEEIAESQLDS